MDEPADLTDDLWRILGSISDWVRFADAKAGAALAVVVLSIGLALAALSALAAVWTVVPRMRKLGADSMIHYGRIASFDTAESFAAELREPLSDPDRASWRGSSRGRARGPRPRLNPTHPASAGPPTFLAHASGALRAV